MALHALGGVATPAWRSKQLFTSAVHALEECPRPQSLAMLKRYGLGPVGSSEMLCSYASTHGWMRAGSVWIVGP